MNCKSKFSFSTFFFSFLIVLQSENIVNEELALHHFMQGEFLMNQGNYALAILEFQDAISLDPNASTIHVSIADGYTRLGKLNRAENHLKIAIDLDPNYKEGLDMLGQIYFSQKKYLDAQTIYKKLNLFEPNNLDYIFTLADLYRIQKEWDTAIDYYLQGYEVNTIAINGLEQALQIALTTSKFIRAEEICD